MNLTPRTPYHLIKPLNGHLFERSLVMIPRIVTSFDMDGKNNGVPRRTNQDWKTYIGSSMHKGEESSSGHLKKRRHRRGGDQRPPCSAINKM